MMDASDQIIHGNLVRDPYRWLEDPNHPQTRDWILGQQRRCERYFGEYGHLKTIECRVRAYLDVEIVDQPARVGDRYFYRKRSVGQDQGSICVREIASGKERVLVDPSGSGKYVSAGIHRIAPDGTVLAYEVRRGGADRKEIRFVDVETGTFLPNRITRGYSRGLAFSYRAYFYCHEAEELAGDHTIYYGRLGSHGTDSAVFRVPRSKGSRLVLIADRKRLGALWLRPYGRETIASFWIAEPTEETTKWVRVFRDKCIPYGPILWHDRILALAETPSGNSQIIELSHDGEELGVFVPEKESLIRQTATTGDRMFVSYTNRGVTTIDSWTPNGNHAPAVSLPDWGTIRIQPTLAEETNHLFYTLESFDIPPAIYEFSCTTNVSVLWHQQEPSFPGNLRRVWETTVPSFDGVRIPITLVAADDAEMFACPRAVVMTTYGGFGISLSPHFSVLASILIELGGVLALPHVRGGGEFGKAWHDAGRVRNRQVSLDDFIAAAKWLSKEGMTTPRQLGIFGGSNSGLLVSSVMTQCPDLFGAVLCIAPLLDMVRYESFDQAARWIREYGTVEDPEDFQALFAYSPYHHISEDIDYPATFFVTGDKDDRCNPAHVRKMAALLQQRSVQTSPVIVDYSEERGHTPALPLSVRIPALARRIAFLCRELKIDIPDGGFDETTDH